MSNALISDLSVPVCMFRIEASSKALDARR